MRFDAKKLFESVYKRNKRLTITVVFGIFFILLEIVGAGIYKYTNILEFTQDKVIMHDSRLDSIEKKMVTQDVFSRDVIKRVSFSNYINRKDEEYHEQMEINNLISSRIGFIEGQILMFTSIFNSFSFFDRCKDEVDCE